MEASVTRVARESESRVAGNPLVSVIICVYNDKSHVLDAVDSVLTQTLNGVEAIVVDDCSTDDTYEYLTSLYSCNPKVAISQTEKNTGGPGGPRNVGIEIARAPYVTFLDSDDVLDRHACYNLLHAAEEYCSDITVGRTRRFNVSERKFERWHSRLFRNEYFLESVEDDPEIAIDTIAVAKLYRREFLRELNLWFREGVHYEDLMFTAEAFAYAHGIAVIPESVYYWNIYPQPVRKSITNQRDDIKNLRDRKLAIDRVLEIAGANSNPRLRARLQLKVLRHDARLYLNDIAFGKSKKIAEELLTELKSLIRMIPESAFDELTLAERLLMASALVGNRKLITRTVNIARGEYDLYGDWAGDDRAGIWEPAVFGNLPKGSLERRLVTFDPSKVAGVPWYNFKWNHRAKSVKIDHTNKVTIEGVTPDSFSKIARSQVQARAVIREKSGAKRRWASPATYTYDCDTNTIKWVLEFRFPADLDAARKPRMSVQLEFNDGATYSSQPIRLRRKVVEDGLKTHPSSLVDKLANVRYRPYCSKINTLGFRVSPVTKRRKQLRALIAPLVAREKQRIDFDWMPMPVAERDTKGTAIIEKYSGPLDENLVVVESHMGKSHFDSPRAIADQLSKSRPDLKIVWVAAPGRNWALGLDNVVIRHSARYYRTLAKAKYIVDNQGLPNGYVKRDGQVYVQTWHGIPLKKMGFDESSMCFVPKERVENLHRKVGYWDYLTVPSNYFQRTLVPAFQFTGAALPHGSPRNDAMVNGAQNSQVWKRLLGLDEHRTTVLYAPTFREAGSATLELDLSRFVDSLGEDIQLLVRPHYLNAMDIPRSMRSDVVDVSAVGDANRVLMASDVLVTDYSSIMFDYLVLDRPIILYAYDYADYTQSARGTYFDLHTHAPGPLAMTQEKLTSELRKLVDGQDNRTEVRSAFRDRFAGREPGNSAETTVETVWSVS